ncbi:MAG: protein-disulfide reductase DsbD domain-containing protein [Hyphomicrobiales bacterium]
MPAPAMAGGGISGWSGPDAGKMRLIAGGPGGGGEIHAGLEFKLAPGWKTYWRAPGDSGIPPEFNWTGSENIKAVKVHWPAPVRFKDDFGYNVGYKEDVVFPLTVTLGNDDKPARLNLTAQFGICREICLPAEAKLSLSIRPDGVPSNQPAIEQALKSVPKAVVPGIEVAGVSARDAQGKVILDVHITAGKGDKLDVFVEGPMDYYLEMPKKKETAQVGEETFSIGVDGVSSAGDLTGKKFTVTVVQGSDALERTVILE